MNLKIKKSFEKVGEFFRSLTKQKFIIITGLISVVFCIIAIHNGFDEVIEQLWKAFMFSSFCGIPAVVLTQNFKSLKRHFIQLAVSLVSAGGMFLLLHFVTEESYSNMYFLGANFVLVCFIVYIFVPKEKCDSYYANVFGHFLFTFLLTLIAFLGSVLLCYAFSGMIFEIESFHMDDLIVSMAAIFFQFCFTVIYSYLLLEKRKEPSTKLFRVVFLYVILPVYLLLIGLLYIYLLKSLFTLKLPQGQINWFVSFATAIYLVFYFILQEYRKEKIIGFFYRFGGLILIPLIMVQFPAFFIRLNAYGFTGWRYTSLLYNIFATVCIVFTFIKNGKYVKYAIPVLGCLGIIASFTPANLINVAYESQYGRMVNILQKYEMFDGAKFTEYDAKEIESKITDEDLESLIGAFNYIKRTSEHKKPEWIKQEDSYSDYIFNIRKDRKKEIETGNWNVWNIDFDVSGYDSLKKAKELHDSDCKDHSHSNLILKDYILDKDCILRHNRYSMKPLVIDVDEKTRIVIINYNYVYDVEDESFDRYTVEFYELKKK